MPLFDGLTAATFTPFNERGTLHFEPIAGYVDYLIAEGMTGLYVCGTTGEGISMTVAERQQAVEVFLETTAGRIPVAVQVGANSLDDARTLAAHAETAGVAAISANAPSYFRIDNTQVLADCMICIAEAAPRTPFYYYHIPNLTGTLLDMTAFLTIMEARCPTFAGVKYSDSKAFIYQEAAVYGNGKYEILWGCDEMLLSALVLGCSGGIGSTYSLQPAIYRELMAAWHACDLEAARKWQARSWLFVKIFSKYGHPLATQKAILRMLGFDFGPCRLPIPLLADEAEEKLLAELKEHAFL